MGKTSFCTKDLYKNRTNVPFMEEKLDKKDLKILDVLYANSDWPVRKVAKFTQLPITTVHNRIIKLKKTGVIQKYTIVPDYKKLDKSFVAYILISADLKYLKKQNGIRKIRLFLIISNIKVNYLLQKVYL